MRSYYAGDEESYDEPDFEREESRDDHEDVRDIFIDRAAEELLAFFGVHPESVFYQRQLQVIFENDFFHWITVRALSQLVENGRISREREPFLGAETPTGYLTLYRANSYRYWKREADEIVRLVSKFSESSFTAALGAQGETLFDAALPTAGFMPKGRSVRSYGGRSWTDTKHDLDRIFERDGIAYGAEIKNTLSYIDRDELDTKLEMCKVLNVRALFIMRMAPKSYIEMIREAGGFSLIFKYQLYPFGQKAFADEVRNRLQLPTDCPVRIEEGTIQRLLKGHQKFLSDEKV